MFEPVLREELLELTGIPGEEEKARLGERRTIELTSPYLDVRGMVWLDVLDPETVRAMLLNLNLLVRKQKQHMPLYYINRTGLGNNPIHRGYKDYRHAFNDLADRVKELELSLAEHRDRLVSLVETYQSVVKALPKNDPAYIQAAAVLGELKGLVNQLVNEQTRNRIYQVPK